MNISRSDPPDDAGRCSAIDGLFKSRTHPVPVPLELIGCDLSEPMLTALRRPGQSHRRWGRLLVLDHGGAVMASLTMALGVAHVRPSVLGGTLVDVTRIDGGNERPSSAARPVWGEWHQGPPAEPNLWSQYDAQGSAEWLNLTTRAWRIPPPSPDRSGGEHHLDGRFVTDQRYGVTVLLQPGQAAEVR